MKEELGSSATSVLTRTTWHSLFILGLFNGSDRSSDYMSHAAAVAQGRSMTWPFCKGSSHRALNIGWMVN
jgi:hypothetical protein